MKEEGEEDNAELCEIHWVPSFRINLEVLRIIFPARPEGTRLRTDEERSFLTR